MWTSRVREALTMLIVAVVCTASQAWTQTASGPQYELFLQTTNGPSTVTFEIRASDNAVWEAVLGGEEQTHLTGDPRYVDPEDITMPGEYHQLGKGWDCNGQVTPVLGRGHYVITVQPYPQRPADTLLVDCYGTSFLGYAIVLYDARWRTFKVGGQVVKEVDLYDDPDGLQPTPPRNLRCTNSRSFGEHPHFAWDPPEHPQGATITYDIYRDVGDGYHRLNTSPITATEYTDTGVRILKFGNPSYYYVTAAAAHSPESDPSNTVVINTDTAAKPGSRRDGRQAGPGQPSAKDATKLLPPAPNPFNSTTVLSYRIANAAFVKLRVMDLTGRVVSQLVSGYKGPGVHRVAFRAGEMPSGVYLVILQAGRFRQCRKILLLK